MIDSTKEKCPVAATNRAGREDASNIAWMVSDCNRSGLQPADIEALGWYATKDGYAIPYMHPESGRPMTTPDGRAFVRTRLRNPKGACKYLSPPGGGIRCFIHPWAHQALESTPDLPLYLTEGEKKSVLSTLLGMPVIGLGGIWMWKAGKDDDGLNDDLTRYVQTGRDVVIIFDSDAAETPRKARDFAECSRRLAVALEPCGSRLYRFDLPPVDGCDKTGLDDWLLANGGDVMHLLALIEGRAGA